MKKIVLAAVLICSTSFANGASTNTSSFDAWAWLQSLFSSPASTASSATNQSGNVGNSIVDDLNGLIR